MLRDNGIFLLDFESEAYIWIGKSVPKPLISKCYKIAMIAMTNAHCSGRARMRQVTLNLVFQGYEP